MDFGLSKEQRLLQDTIRGFAAAECPPARLRPLFEAGQGHDPALWKGLAEIGVAGLTLPEERRNRARGARPRARRGGDRRERAAVPFLGHALAGLAIAWGGSHRAAHVDVERARRHRRPRTAEPVHEALRHQSAAADLGAGLRRDRLGRARRADSARIPAARHGHARLVDVAHDGRDRGRRLQHPAQHHRRARAACRAICTGASDSQRFGFFG